MSRETRRRVHMKEVVLCAACLVGGALGHSMTQAWADGDPTTETMARVSNIPYHGYLMLDSTPTNGPVRMRFEIFEEAAGGAAPQWTEEQLVQVDDGRFSVELGGSKAPFGGSVTQFDEMLLDGQALWVGITVLEDDGQGGALEIALSGRQALTPGVYAAWSRYAADFDVAGALDVAGQVSVLGELRVGDNLDVGGTRLMSSGRKPLLTHGASDTLSLNDDASLAGVVIDGPEVEIAGALDANGAVTFGGGTTIPGDLRVANRKDLEVNGATFSSDAGVIDMSGPIAGGPTGLRLSGSPLLGDAMHIAPNGDVVIENDLIIRENLGSGRFARFRTEFTIDPPTKRSTAGLTSTGLHQDDGFCFLSGIRLSNQANSTSKARCELLINGSTGIWELRNGQNAPRTNIDCTAHCLRY